MARAWYQPFKSCYLFPLFIGIVAALGVAQSAAASILGVTPEPDSWSDLAYPAVAGGFTAGTGEFTISIVSVFGVPLDVPDLEIGSQYGPSNSGSHYGTFFSDYGDSFHASISITAGTISSPDGTASGTFLVEFLTDDDPNGIAADYGLSPGDDLLVGNLTQAAIFDSTLDIEFEITGGALQTFIYPPIGTNFSSGNLGLLRFTIAGGATPPSDFSADFDVESLDVYGAPVPEPGCTTLAVFGLILAWVGGSRRCYSMHRVE